MLGSRASAAELDSRGTVDVLGAGLQDLELLYGSSTWPSQHSGEPDCVMAQEPCPRAECRVPANEEDSQVAGVLYLFAFPRAILSNHVGRAGACPSNGHRLPAYENTQAQYRVTHAHTEVMAGRQTVPTPAD